MAPSLTRTAAAVALAAGSITVASAMPASAADPVTIQLLGINDFHGRIDPAITPTFATTIEQLRVSDPSGDGTSTALVGAGDLIGASLFASSSAQDNPTIDVLNALGLDASAVGNHEFDQGFADLTDRVIPRAEWEYLGANVYEKGTQTPALPEYTILDVKGVKVAVIGAVTEETPSLVSPGGITQIDIGDPVEAVNRVAAEIEAGDLADVTVATFHEGSATGATYDEAVAAGGPFAEIVEDTDPSVDVIFTGHTHRAYAFNAPIPGVAGKTRPVLQTGSYAANVGKVTVTVDTDTDVVSAYAMQNVARATTADTTLPVVQEVKNLTDAAVAESAIVGNKPVASITDDISRAMLDATNDDRLSESSLGNLIANALRDSLEETPGGADIGLVNPGGIRASLVYAGDTSTNPANTDGVVTYAEANAVLPFVNNLWTITVTGEELEEVLEQQWQPAGASRPFLHLGLSDNMSTTLDPTRPVGSRVTSVWIDGKPLDPAKEYKVATFSFLGTGGDNFTSFTKGTSVDSGLVDRDAWIAYLGENSPLSPSFDRRQVYAAGLPDSVVADQDVEIDFTKLDLASVPNQANTSISLSLRPVGSGPRVFVDTFDVENGAATVAFTAPSDLVGEYTVVAEAEPTGTLIGPAEVASSVSATAAKATYGRAATVDVTVDSTEPATGTVQIRKGSTVLGTATVVGGAAEVELGRTTLRPGAHTLTVDYLGAPDVAASQGTVTLTVAKATSTTQASSRPAEVKVDRTRAQVRVVVRTAGFVPAGRVEIRSGGQVIGRGTLDDGEVTVTVKRFTTTGRKNVAVRYLGNDLANGSTDTITIRVVK